MKAVNLPGQVIRLEGSYLEMACLHEVLVHYCQTNPTSIDIDIIKGFVKKLEKPEVRTEKELIREVLRDFAK